MDVSPVTIGFGINPPARQDEHRRMQELYQRCRTARNWLPSEVVPADLPPPSSERHREVGWQLASQGVYAEQVGLLVAATLLQETDDLTARFALATAVSDEAKHSEAFMRYARAAGGEVVDMGEPVQRIFDGLYSLEDPIDRFMAHTLLEGFAADEFAVLGELFAGDPLGELYRIIRKDETRHVALGLVHMQQLATDEDTRAEIAERLPRVDRVAEGIGDLAAVGESFGRIFDIDGAALEANLRHKHRIRLESMTHPHTPEAQPSEAAALVHPSP